jgi:hypothetical protein
MNIINIIFEKLLKKKLFSFQKKEYN